MVRAHLGYFAGKEIWGKKKERKEKEKANI
jgi:hypothetical protein